MVEWNPVELLFLLTFYFGLHFFAFENGDHFGRWWSNLEMENIVKFIDKKEIWYAVLAYNFKQILFL